MDNGSLLLNEEAGKKIFQQYGQAVTMRWDSEPKKFLRALRRYTASSTLESFIPAMDTEAYSDDTLVSAKELAVRCL